MRDNLRFLLYLSPAAIGVMLISIGASLGVALAVGMAALYAIMIPRVWRIARTSAGVSLGTPASGRRAASTLMRVGGMLLVFVAWLSIPGTRSETVYGAPLWLTGLAWMCVSYVVAAIVIRQTRRPRH